MRSHAKPPPPPPPPQDEIEQMGGEKVRGGDEEGRADRRKQHERTEAKLRDKMRFSEEEMREDPIR